MSSHVQDVLCVSVIFAVSAAVGHLYHGCILSIPRDCLTQACVSVCMSVCVFMCVQTRLQRLEKCLVSGKIKIKRDTN